MKTTTAVASMLASAAIGAAAAGWVVSTHGDGPAVTGIADEARPPLARTPVGDLAGAPAAHIPLNEANPLGDTPGAVAEGQRLFVRMNCAGCHNYGGRGGMGPDLTDYHWDFGGTPAAIFKSIYEGHSKGMPAWGRALSPELIWQLTAYVHSLGGGVPPSQVQAERHGDFVPNQRDTLKYETPDPPPGQPQTHKPDQVPATARQAR